MRVPGILANPVQWSCLALAAAVLAGCGKTTVDSTVVAGNARFEFLTSSLVRMEYSSSGSFTDAPTAVVQQRSWSKVPVQSTQQNGWLVLSSSALTLRYRLQSGAFSAANLEVSWKDTGAGAHSWRPGDKDLRNLGGLPYSLDNVSAENLPTGRPDTQTPVNDMIPGIDLKLAEAQPGLLSRAGYAFIDDSQTPVWNVQRAWVEPRPSADGQDWYLFTYGSDYRQVLREYARLCGPVPMVPRYVLGPMVTDLNFEYFPDAEASHQPQFQRYNQQHLEEEISRLRDSQIPLDTLVLDFAWHNYGWDGGYDWSPLIPQPEEFSDWLHRRGVKLSLNDHPGYINTGESILSFADSHAPQVLKALGRPQPPQPSFDLDISRKWLFSPDPHDEGLRHHWYLTSTSAGARWKSIRVGLPWQSQGYPDYRGVGWYRTFVQLPAKLPAKLYLYLGEVGGTYRIFINGQEAAHSQIHWPHRLTYTDVRPYLRAGRQNDIVLRVEPGERGGSGLLLGPVALRDVEPPKPISFDLSNQQQAEVFMRDLHGPLLRAGVDFWWVDGGSGASDMPGLNKQLWTNKVFYDYTRQLTGKRAFILGRYGDWGSERYPGYFTGDTYSQWPVLAYEVSFTARAGNVLVPYVSHDIGGFHGGKIDFDLYARWLEFGAFSPILRMHSAHENPLEGNLRMPWIYGDEGIALMRKYFTLRTQLLPYLYTYTWRAHRDSEPLLRPLYLEYPRLEEAYHHSREYFFGDQMLVSPVVAPEQEHSVYLPPGRWFDFFSGKSYSGGTTFSAHYAVDEIPVFVRDGALIPEQEASRYSDEKPLDRIILNVYGTGQGHFELYEDDGISLAYRKGEYAVTSLTYTTGADGSHHLVIEPTKGSYQGQPGARSYELRIRAAGQPASISVDGQLVGAGSWDAAQSATVVSLPSRSIHDRREIVWH